MADLQNLDSIANKKYQFNPIAVPKLFPRTSDENALDGILGVENWKIIWAQAITDAWRSPQKKEYLKADPVSYLQENYNYVLPQGINLFVKDFVDNKAEKIVKSQLKLIAALEILKHLKFDQSPRAIVGHLISKMSIERFRGAFEEASRINRKFMDVLKKNPDLKLKVQNSLAELPKFLEIEFDKMKEKKLSSKLVRNFESVSKEGRNDNLRLSLAIAKFLQDKLENSPGSFDSVAKVVFHYMVLEKFSNYIKLEIVEGLQTNVFEIAEDYLNINADYDSSQFALFVLTCNYMKSYSSQALEYFNDTLIELYELLGIEQVIQGLTHHKQLVKNGKSIPDYLSHIFANKTQLYRCLHLHQHQELLEEETKGVQPILDAFIEYGASKLPQALLDKVSQHLILSETSDKIFQTLDFFAFLLSQVLKYINFDVNEMIQRLTINMEEFVNFRYEDRLFYDLPLNKFFIAALFNVTEEIYASHVKTEHNLLPSMEEILRFVNAIEEGSIDTEDESPVPFGILLHRRFEILMKNGVGGMSYQQMFECLKTYLQKHPDATGDEYTNPSRTNGPDENGWDKIVDYLGFDVTLIIPPTPATELQGRALADYNQTGKTVPFTGT